MKRIVLIALLMPLPETLLGAELYTSPYYLNPQVSLIRPAPRCNIGLLL